MPTRIVFYPIWSAASRVAALLPAGGREPSSREDLLERLAVQELECERGCGGCERRALADDAYEARRVELARRGQGRLPGAIRRIRKWQDKKVAG